MVFSSITFIYYFLPLVILFYFIVPNKYRNFILLLFSLVFYFYGEKEYVLILLFSCFFNFYISKLLDKKKSRLLFYLSIIVNLGMLCYFKYFNFFIENINSLFNINISYLHVIMPIGISFFTFQALSYVIDVYKGRVECCNNFINFACYISLFPQLVAGPIVRYSDINKELLKRHCSFENFSLGIKRFIIGLSKKILIANVIGELINLLLDLQNPSILSYILLALSYTIQIYFDFSGYSDMAIGLGKIFGFSFLENFNYPYIASSITDFWRRWHISLSSFFKDYVYIPLGGNRKGKLRQIFNIFIVWLLTGFWHGADWNFILWGLYFAILLLIEKFFVYKFLEKHKIFSHIYTLFFVIISFVIFSCGSVNEVFIFLKNMFGFTDISFVNNEVLYYFKSYFIIILLSVILSTPLIRNLLNKITNNKLVSALEIIIYLFLLILCTSFLIDSSFNPFLYFRF